MTWKLIGLSDGIAGQSINVDRDLLIGRHQQADIVLQSALVSRRHAGIELKEDGSIWISDLGSSNGTFVNGQQISEPTQLHNGDEIHFQEIIFQVLSEQDAEVVEQQLEDKQLDSDDETQSLANAKPSDEGMPTLQQRTDTEVRADGMPQSVSIPKPAPIPADVDINQPAQQTTPTTDERSQDIERAKSAKVGMVVWVILAIILLLALVLFMR
ncbi:MULTISPECIES: FHA domain-containing protein [unclassified Acinetobacter]|uniref:FHA domain-containing protein n=1 Tax=unclassified Acinetobacter TaxID=196816 RepID=UPI0035B7C899